MKAPARQGDFDNACAFYSVVNAFSLIDPKLDRKEFFEALTKCWIDKQPAKQHAYLNGMGRNELNTLLGYAQKKHAKKVKIYRKWWSISPKGLDDFWAVLTDFYEEDPKGVVIIGFQHAPAKGEDFSHWSVVREITKKQIKLFNSNEHNKALPRERCQLWRDDQSFSSSRPYYLDYSGTFFLSAE
jgi:hypothetical protein